MESIDTPIGRVTFAMSERGVCGLGIADGWKKIRGGLEKRFGAVHFEEGSGSAVRRKLEAYFRGRTDALEDIAVDLGGTDFQRQVWKALRSVKAGSTASYADIAEAIDNPTAVRAVGLANGKNPVSLIVPCHRIIGTDGSLTGYGFGLERKRWLLNHEGSLLL
jgi:methylated-DNA-[protein]-cysteine S-methyltransferase